MSSEALEPPFDREQILGRVKVVERGETTLYERALLAEVARLEQERDEREAGAKWQYEMGQGWRQRALTAEAALAVARERAEKAERELEIVERVSQRNANAHMAAHRDLAVAREREQRLRGEIRRFIATEYPDGTEHPADSAADRLARAALVDEPAAATTRGPCLRCGVKDTP